MKNETNNLLNTCLEIEGLLCLIARRGDSIPDNVANLLLEKSGQLHDNIARMVESSTLIDDAEEQQELKVTEAVEETYVSLDSEADSEAVAESANCEEEADAHEGEPVATVEEPIAEPVEEVKKEPVAEKHDTLKQVRPVRNDTVAIELTVGDKFRFRRELFGNSDVDLAEALQIASQMTSVEDLEDYFYNDLCFDPENEVVKDFIRVVASRF